MSNEVVGTVNGRPVTRSEMKAAFDRVCDASNWKLPIDRLLYDVTGADVDLITEAVIFYTGSVPKFNARGANGVMLAHGRMRVTAAGYYATCGA